jgi:hypothetical protein
VTQFFTIDEACPLTAPGRGDLSSARLEEHLRATAQRLKKIGIRPGMSMASALPEGPDAATAAMAAKMAHIDLLPLPARASRERYQQLLLGFDVQLLLLHSGCHPAREAAQVLGIRVANVLRHFEAGIFTLEIQIGRPFNPPPPPWKDRAAGVPVLLVAPNTTQRSLAKRLNGVHPVLGVTPPSLEDLPLPHTIEHIAAECVRTARRDLPAGPVALAGWRTGALIALEMARLLEEQGERVVFVAMLDASDVRSPMGDAVRRYRPRPWFGKILHVRPRGQSADAIWRRIAPQGVASYEVPADTLAEPNVEVVARILTTELSHHGGCNSAT